MEEAGDSCSAVFCAVLSLSISRCRICSTCTDRRVWMGLQMAGAAWLQRLTGKARCLVLNAHAIAHGDHVSDNLPGEFTRQQTVRRGSTQKNVCIFLRGSRINASVGPQPPSLALCGYLSAHFRTHCEDLTQRQPSRRSSNLRLDGSRWNPSASKRFNLPRCLQIGGRNL